jgi:hypothetical protein
MNEIRGRGEPHTHKTIKTYLHMCAVSCHCVHTDSVHTAYAIRRSARRRVVSVTIQPLLITVRMHPSGAQGCSFMGPFPTPQRTFEAICSVQSSAIAPTPDRKTRQLYFTK